MLDKIRQSFKLEGNACCGLLRFQLKVWESLFVQLGLLRRGVVAGNSILRDFMYCTWSGHFS